MKNKAIRIAAALVLAIGVASVALAASALYVDPGLSVSYHFDTGNYVKFSLRPYPQTPGIPFAELVIDRKLHGQSAPAIVQLQTDQYGNVVVRVHEGPGLSALVVDDNGQQYP